MVSSVHAQSSISMSLAVECFILSNSIDGLSDLKLTAKRYTPVGQISRRSAGSLTLILTHGIAHHKEHWEPVLECLFQLQENNSQIHVHEAWSFDCLNHGDGAIVNEETLRARKNAVSSLEWGQIIYSFLMTGYISGHRLVAIGHSFGTLALLYAVILSSSKASPFAAMILVEPPLSTREIYNGKIRDVVVAAYQRAISKRRDTWSNREEAYRYMSQRVPWKLWDDAALRIYVEHGLRSDLSPDKCGDTVVTLKCSKQQEESTWMVSNSTFDIMDDFGTICSALPVHIIFGDRNDVLPQFLKDWLLNTYGQNFRSVQSLHATGHLIPQESPGLLSKAIFESLTQTFAPLRTSL